MEYRFNETLKTIPPSASLAIGEKAKALKAAGVDLITLATGEPDFDTPDAARIAGIRAIAEGHTHYTERVLPCATASLPSFLSRCALRLRF